MKENMSKGGKCAKQMLFCAILLSGTAQAAPHLETNPIQETVSADSARMMDIDELVIIATPKENSQLRQLPLSATSISQQDMRSKGIQNVKSLTGLVPNLFIPDYGSKLTTSVYVRGIGSRINTPAVGLYVDNIPFIDKSAFDFNYSDIERIDVLRGPQSTLYGRNTMGGLVRIFTKSPFTYQGTDVRLSGALYHDYKASVSHYHRISHQFAFSANLFYDHKGGFFENKARGNNKIDQGDEAGGRLRAIYRPKDNLKLDFTLNYEFTNQGGYPYAYTGKTDGQEDRQEYVGKIAYNSKSGYKRNLLNAGLNLKHQNDVFILSSVTGFQFLKDRMNLDQDFTEKDIYTMIQKQNSKTLSEEIVLKSVPGNKWQWTTGVSGFYQWLDTKAPVTFQSDGMAWLNGMTNTMANKYMPPISMGPMTMNFVFSDRIQGEALPIAGSFRTPVWNGALFHQSTFNDLFGAEGLSFTLGLRLDYEHLYLDYNTGCHYTHTYELKGKLIPGNREITMVPARSFDKDIYYKGALHHGYLQWLPKVAVKYDFDKQNNIYATVSKGYRSGGYNIQMFSDILQGDMRSANMKDVAQVTIQALEHAPMVSEEIKQQVAGILNGMAHAAPVDVEKSTLYKPEYSWNYELGAHLGLFQGKLKVDLAAYYMDTRNQQISRFAQSGLGRITVNAGKSRSIGAEAAFAARITDAFALNGNYGFTHATFTDYVVSDKVSYNGQYVPFVPMHTFGVGAQYVFAMKPHCWLDNVTLHADYRGAGRIYWTEANNVSQPFYGTLNGRISANKGEAQIGLWIKNALNTDYQTIYFETMGRGFEQSGRPLQVGIDLQCRF